MYILCINFIMSKNILVTNIKPFKDINTPVTGLLIPLVNREICSIIYMILTFDTSLYHPSMYKVFELHQAKRGLMVILKNFVRDISAFDNYEDIY